MCTSLDTRYCTKQTETLNVPDDFLALSLSSKWREHIVHSLNLNVDSARISSCLPASRSRSQHSTSSFRGSVKNLTLLSFILRLLQLFTTQPRGIIINLDFQACRKLLTHGCVHFLPGVHLIGRKIFRSESNRMISRFSDKTRSEISYTI